MILEKIIFKLWVNFDKVMSVYSQKIAKKNYQKFLFAAIPDK